MKRNDDINCPLGNLNNWTGGNRFRSAKDHDRVQVKRALAARHNRSRQGVGMIIGGVILAAILFTSVYYFFFVIMEGQVIRGKTDANIQQLENDKKLEQLAVTSFANQTTDTINIKIKNTGSIPSKIAYVLMYDTKSVPIDNDITTEKKDLGLNSGHETVLNTGLADDESAKYRIDAITERGNIVTALWPPSIAETGQDGSNTVSTGSFQVDLKSFGVIFPKSPARDGVDQTGWEARFGDGIGYPAFSLPGSSLPWNANTTSPPLKPEALVVRVRNIDPSGENMTLYANTGLGLTLNAPDQHQQGSGGLYLCYADPELKKFDLYSHKTFKKVILPNAFGTNISADYGWTYLYFCDATPGNTHSHTSVKDWEARRYLPDLSPLMFIVRGEFERIYTQYGQAIPAQAVTITDDRLTACLKSTGDLPADLCKSLPGAGDKYRVRIGDEVWIYLSGPIVSPPYNTKAIWINPDGQAQNLLATPSSMVNPFSIVIPDKEPDGTPIKVDEFYIIQIFDKNDNIYSVTIQVIP